MLAYLRFRWDLHQLESEQRRVGTTNKAAMARARQTGKSPDDVYAMEQEGASYYFHFQDEIQKIGKEGESRAVHHVAARDCGYPRGIDRACKYIDGKKIG